MYSDSESDESRPRTPSEEDCCRNACDPCIFDVHKKLLEEYENRKKRNLRTKIRRSILHPCLYKSFVVRSVEKISTNYILLSLAYPEDEGRNDTGLLVDPGQYVMLHSRKLTRPYTPISWSRRSIDFLIKLYPNGKFTSYLRDLKSGDKIDVRGPYGDFKYERNSFRRIVMFSIGSGVAAFYPIAKRIIDDESDETRIHLVGGFQTIAQIPLKKDLQDLTDYWNFKCTLHISQPIESRDLHGIEVKAGRLEKDRVSEVLRGNPNDETLILICGTEQFNRSVEEWTRDMNYKHIYVFK